MDNHLYDDFDMKYQIPNFIKEGVAATIFTDKGSDRGNTLGFLKKLFIATKITKMKEHYATYILARAEKSSVEPLISVSIDAFTLMIESIRIIRYGLIDELPGMREALPMVFDKLPFEHKNFEFLAGCRFFPDQESSFEEEAFAKYILNMEAAFKLSDVQKDRVYGLLKNRRDKDIFQSLAMARMRDFYLSQQATVITEVLAPTVDKIGVFDYGSVGNFLSNLSNTEMIKLKQKIPDLNSLKGHTEMQRMYEEFVSLK